MRNHYIGRTFIEPKQSIRSFGVRIKLNPVRDLIAGKRVILIDDSIVRGTTSKKIVQMVREAGAKEIHMRISCPPTISPCYYGVDTPNTADLIAAQMSVEEIRLFIGADSLGYLSLAGMMEATGISSSTACVACWNEKYPTRIPRMLRLAGHVNVKQCRLKDEMRKQLPGIGPTLLLFCLASAPAAPATPAAFQDPPTASQNRSDPLVVERSALVNSLRGSAAGLQDPSIQPEIPIDVFQIYSLPLAIGNASFRKTKRGDSIKLVISNSSNEQILGVRYWLLVVDSTNRVRRAVDQSESLKLDAYAAKDITFPAPARLKTAADDRLFLVLAQVIGRDSIWEVQQSKSALLAYVKGNGYNMPSVLRLLNQVDSPIGFSPIF